MSLTVNDTKRGPKTFNFDRVFGPTTSQEEVFHDTSVSVHTSYFITFFYSFLILFLFFLSFLYNQQLTDSMFVYLPMDKQVQAKRKWKSKKPIY